MESSESINQPILSILIPTYNREKDLRRLLAVVIPFVERKPDVELIVSNNGSADGTAAFIESLPPNPRIRIVNQPIGYGVHIHLGWIYGQARGRFLWMIGDDDMVEPALMERVCGILRAEPELGWIHLPHRFIGLDKPVNSPCPAEVQRLTKGREIFPSHLRWITFVTANVIRSGEVHASLPKLRFNHSFWPMTLLTMATADLPAMILNECKIEGGLEITWKDEVSEISNFHLPIAIFESPVFTIEEQRAALLAHYTNQPEYLDRLIFLRPSLLFRIFRRCPKLCSLSFVVRVVKKVWRRVTGNGPKAQPR